MIPQPRPTALRNTCVLETPDAALNAAFQYAKDNLARCMRWYTLGWGMSNAPHMYTIVVGRDTGWMSMGTDYIAPWFAPEALKVFGDRQKPNGQILEYIDMETDERVDYGLNIADNTPYYIWGVWHHWQQYQDRAFLDAFLPSTRAAGDYLLREIHDNGLLCSIPVGDDRFGITSWRNIIPDTVLAGEVTEINALTAHALRQAAQLTGEARYADGAQHIAQAINRELWTGENYALNRFEGRLDASITGDNLFPLLTGIADATQRKKVLARLSEPDFWTPRGMRTVPNTSPIYHPSRGFGLVGGSWPNLTLWYAAAVAQDDPDRALAALDMVAQPVVQASNPAANVVHGEFPEFFDGDTGVNGGMHLSPWVAPTFIWAVLEGLLGLTWQDGVAHFDPHWPSDWTEVRLRNVPSRDGSTDFVLRRE